MSLGKGAVLSSSMKHELNTNRSTEWELLGSHYGMILVLRGKHFINSQGYRVEHNRLYQDIKNTFLMKNNGRDLSSKRKKYTKAI